MRFLFVFLFLAGAFPFAQAAEPARGVLWVVQVIAHWPSATPDEIERKLVAPLEKELRKLRPVVGVNITTRGSSMKVDVRFAKKPGEAEEALVNEALSRVKPKWPTGSKVVSISVQPNRWDDWDPPR